MKTLYFITNEELVRFANERGVQVVASEDDADEDYLIERHELVDLPTQVPRFEELIPEIRNLIYEELLCIEDGQFSCFPEILSTNKQIHEEACGILYGKNDIDVQLSNDGIIIQGSSSNAYLESRFGSRPAHTRSSIQRSIEDVEWPDFLRRVQSLRFTIIDSHRSHFTDIRKVSNENVLYSLCTFLSNDHKLKKFGVDLRRRDRQDRVVAKTSDLHCLLLLDPLPTLKIEGDGMFDQLTVDSKVDLRTVGRSSLAVCRDFRDECQRFDRTMTHPLTPRDKDLLLVFTDMAVRAFNQHIRPVINNAKLGKGDAAMRFSSFVDDVRESMDRYDIPLRKPSALIDALDKVLHFEIDATVSRHAAERMAEEMEADE